MEQKKSQQQVDKPITVSFHSAFVFIRKRQIVLSICRNTLAIKVIKDNEFNQSQYSHTKQAKQITAHAIYGMIELETGTYLIIVNQVTKIGEILGKTILQINRVEFYRIDAKQQDSKDSQYIVGLETLLNEGLLYYSDDYDITRQVSHNLNPKTQPQLNQYFINEFVANQFNHVNPNIIIKCILGMVKYDSDTQNSIDRIELLFISRTDRRRLGRRWFCRGTNQHGNAANTVQTEQILIVNNQDTTHIMSYAHLRGSIPFSWSQQPDLNFQPNQRLLGTSDTRMVEFVSHFNQLKKQYGEISIINLIRHTGREGRLDNEYVKFTEDYNKSEQLKPLTENQHSGTLNYVTFDFNKECGKGNFNNIVKLLARIQPQMNSYGINHFITIKSQSLNKYKQLSQQKGIFRINCIDCVDRTNCAQYAISKIILLMMLDQLSHDAQPLQKINNNARADRFNEKLTPNYEKFLRNSWRDNANYIGQFYVGTDGMKTYYVHSGEWPLKGIIKDVCVSIKRYWLGNFFDSKTQDMIDLLMGHIQPHKNPFKHSRFHYGHLYILSLLSSPFLGNFLYKNFKYPLKTAEHIPTNNQSVSLLEQILIGLVSVFIVLRLFRSLNSYIVRKPIIRKNTTKNINQYHS